MSEPIYNKNPEVVDIQPDPQKGKLMAILSYFGLLVLIPIFAAKDDKYAQFHAKQGALLFIFEVAYAIATTIIKVILGLIFKPTVYLWYYVPHPIVNVFTIIFNLGYIFFFVLAILGIVNAATGKSARLPIIGNFTFLDKLFNKEQN